MPTIEVAGLVVKTFGASRALDGLDLHRRLAYVPGDVSLWPNLSGGEIIDLLTRMRHADRDIG